MKTNQIPNKEVLPQLISELEAVMKPYLERYGENNLMDSAGEQELPALANSKSITLLKEMHYLSLPDHRLQNLSLSGCLFRCKPSHLIDLFCLALSLRDHVPAVADVPELKWLLLEVSQELLQRIETSGTFKDH